MVPMTAPNLRAERMRRIRCRESRVFVVGGGHGYVIVEIAVEDIAQYEIKEWIGLIRSTGRDSQSQSKSTGTT